MTRRFVPALVAFVLCMIVQPACAPASRPSATLRASGVVRVAPPTGQQESDRASILAALERAQPGDTIQFARGLYLVGELIRVAKAGITFVGHAEGTTLRGCRADVYEELERDVVRIIQDLRATPPRATPNDMSTALFRCGLLELTGGYAFVHRLKFEYTHTALILGCCAADLVVRPTDGGYRIENNTFENLDVAILMFLSSTVPTVVRDNKFSNTFHAISGAGSHVQVLDNEILASEPERIPGRGVPGFAIGLGSGRGDNLDAAANSCQNLIAGNRIEGHPDGIVVGGLPGTTCRRNVIRDNTLVFHRIRYTATAPWAAILFPTARADSTVVGVPIALVSSPDPTGQVGLTEDNLIERNRVIGGAGIGIELSRASRNRIVNNTVSDIARREPYPGNTLGPPPQWEAANGSGIWISPGSNGNEVLGNTFTAIASSAVVLHGDSNQVNTLSARDTVIDMGKANRISGSGGTIRR